MRIVGEFGVDETTNRIDFALRNLRGLAVECNESDGAVRTECLLITSVEIHIDEKIILEERLFDNFVAVTPAAAHFIGGKKSFNTLVREILEDLPFVTGTSIKSVPTTHKRSSVLH